MAKTRCAFLAVLCASTLASAAAAQAAGRSALSLGIAAGRSTPTGFTAEQYESGYQLRGLAELRTPISWVAVRLDGGYQGLGKSTFQFANPARTVIGDGRVTTGLFSGTASVTIRVPNLHSAVRPYALAGVGSYWLHQRVSLVQNDATAQTGSSSTTRLNGTEAGLGLEMPLAQVVIFAEARYQRVGPGPLRFVPMSAGLRLREFGINIK